jgi:hypothetical protein
MKGSLICSSPSLEGIVKMLNKHFYSTTYKVNEDLTVENSKGLYSGVVVEFKKGRYQARYSK